MKQAVRAALGWAGYDLVKAGPFTPRRDPWQDLAAIGHGGDMIFDVGANVGDITRLALSRFPSACVYCFEPYPPVCERLRAAMAGFSRVTVCPKALGEVAGTRTMYANALDVTNSLLPNSPSIAEFTPCEWVRPVGTVTIQVDTLDNFCAATEISRIDILKIDSQGYKLPILRGAKRLLAGKAIGAILAECLFVPLYEGQTEAHELSGFLRSRGYKFVWLYGVARNSDHSVKWGDALFVA